MKQPRILVLSFHFPPSVGGIENYLFNLLSGVSDQVLLITFRVRGWREFRPCRTPRIKRIFPNINRVLSSPLLFKVILVPLNILLFLSGLREINRHRYDVIVAGSADSSPAAFWLARYYNIPFAVIAYGKDVSSRAGRSIWKKLTIYRCLRRARIVITISNYTRRILIDAGVPDDRINIITPGIDPSLMDTPAPEINQADQLYRLSGRPVIITVGRLVARKGHEKVMEILPELVKDFPGLVYLVVGDGIYRQHLEKTAAALDVENHVVFTGYVDRPMLISCLRRCQIMVMPSQSDGTDVEGFGIVFLEAGLFGKPVIGIREGGVMDAIQDGVTGLLVDPGDPRALAGAIIRMLKDSEFAVRLGQAGRETALSAGWDEKSKRFSRILTGIEGF